jgi:DnaK suppressor protein
MRLESDRLQRLRASLLARRKNLLDAIDRRRLAGEEASTPEPRDEADESVRLDAQDEAWRLAEADTKELMRIDAALLRMEDDTFGTCIECGEYIEEKRMIALPTAARCISCQEAREPYRTGSTM